MIKKAIFLDRDGTLIIEKNYLHNPNEVQLEYTVNSALSKLQNAGYFLFIITNQAGIGRGYYTIQDFEAVQKRLINDLSEAGIHITKTYFCPHHPTEAKGSYLKDCPDRKPNPGMLLRASNEFNIDLTRSYMIGDTLTDIQAGQKVGCKTILVKTGHAQHLDTSTLETTPDFIATTLEEAVDNFILKKEPS